MKIDEMDDLYEIVGEEIKRGEERAGLMARATAEADGNPEKAKSIYIRYRVAELAENRQREAERREADLRREAEKKEADLRMERIQDLLNRPPLSMHSCEQILTLLGFKVNTEIHGRWIVKEKTGSTYVLYSEEELRKHTMSTATSILASLDSKPPEPSVLMSQGFIPEILAEVRTSIPGFDALPLGEKVARYMSFELPERLARMHRSCPNPVDKQSTSHSEVKTSKQLDPDQQPAAFNPWLPSRQPAVDQQRLDSSKQPVVEIPRSALDWVGLGGRPAVEQQQSDLSKRLSASEKHGDLAAKDADLRKLSTHWLWFYTYILLPLGILFSFVPTLAEIYDLRQAGHQTQITSLMLVPIVVYDIFICFLIYGLYKRRFWGWVCNWINLGMVVIFNYGIFKEPFEAYIVTVILLSLIVFLPNYFYFKKRRSLFN
jgi:hypothetical protein